MGQRAGGVRGAGGSPRRPALGIQVHLRSGQVRTGLHRHAAFPSAQRGVAVGYITDGKRDVPVSLVTVGFRRALAAAAAEGDAGFPVLSQREPGLAGHHHGSLANHGNRQELGRLPKPPADILRVSFLDEKNGWAVGAQKSILETHDGAQHWTPVEATAPPGESAVQRLYVDCFRQSADRADHRSGTYRSAAGATRRPTGWTRQSALTALRPAPPESTP